jgi:hypothetical protein
VEALQLDLVVGLQWRRNNSDRTVGMFVGHIGVGLAAKAAAPRSSLATLVLAAVLLDLLVWAFVVAGVEHIAIKPGITATNAFDLYDYPISHSLLMAVVWGAAMATAYDVTRRYLRGALLVFIAVVSHWVLDFISHRPDMPLAPGVHHYYGLGLFNSRIGMLLVEGLIWFGGIVIYELTTRSSRRAGFWTFYIGVATLTWLWVSSLSGAAPRIDPKTIGIIDFFFLAILAAWAYVVDRIRITTRQADKAPLVRIAG